MNYAYYLSNEEELNYEEDDTQYEIRSASQSTSTFASTVNGTAGVNGTKGLAAGTRKSVESRASRQSRVTGTGGKTLHLPHPAGSRISKQTIQTSSGGLEIVSSVRGKVGAVHTVPTEITLSALSHIALVLDSVSAVMNIPLPHEMKPFGTYDCAVISPFRYCPVLCCNQKTHPGKGK